MRAEDERLGRLLRLIRHDQRLSQIQLAHAAHVPLVDLKRVEAGRADDIKLGRIRSLFEAVDARARLVPWWNGAAADRLLDLRHAELVERVVAALRLRGWYPMVELSFSEFGERGSIDVFAVHAKQKAIAVCEVKSVIGSLEETNRVLDVKERLAPTIAFKRLGWRPRVVARILIVPQDNTVRRIIQSHAETMDALYPGRSRDVRAWLRSPAQPLHAIWFVSNGPSTSTIRAERA